ncbi:hypothetical protein FHS49_002459 [Sphingobium boeckii]|uniref:Uncharacterized protein n=1 Tax=Sphingobium boeckii TaxID=1082345 RepID=A0A7W9EFW2_9SPHN|nr:hypothetical protein [Sphingobium boeckii]
MQANRVAIAEQLSDALIRCDEAGLLLVGAHVASAIEALAVDRSISPRTSEKQPSDGDAFPEHVADRAAADRRDF